MSTLLHRTLQEHRRFGPGALLPSVLLTVCWVGLQWIIYVAGIVVSTEPGQLVHAAPGFITISQAVTILLLGYVFVDVRRARGASLSWWRLLAGVGAALLLVALFAFLRLVETQIP